MDFEDPFFEELEPGFPEEADEDVGPLSPPWRRPLLIVVAAITAAAMLLIPVYNVLRGQPVADNGLEVCGFDYCAVQDAMIAAGLNEEMSLLANTFLTDEEATALAGALLDRIDATDVTFTIVDRLEADLKGLYDPTERAIVVERPVRAWIVLHEVAHVEASGHDDDFQKALAAMAIRVVGTGD